MSLFLVAGELFPIMVNATHENSIVGITIGFVCGLSLIYGLEAVIGYLEELPPDSFQMLPTSDKHADVGVVDGKF